LVCQHSIGANVQGFVQVGDIDFRLLAKVSQMFRFKLMFYSFAQYRFVKLELKLNSSTYVDGEFRQA
jgi:hypothetical protein